MGNRLYKFIISGVALLTATILFIVIFAIRKYRRYRAAYKEHCRRVTRTLGRLWKCICVSTGLRTSPILIVGGVAYLLFIRHEISADAFFYLIVSSVVIAGLWILVDHLINNKEIDRAFELHDHVEHQDKIAANEIVEGLHRVKFVESFVPGEPTDFIQMRAMINEIAREALIPSIYCDHHCREIMDYEDPMQYIRTKRDLVVDVFNLGHHEDYMQLVLNRLPISMSFEEAVESYISDLVVDVISPALIRCCETKIVYYQSVIRDWSMSRFIRGKAKHFKEKNKTYIRHIQEICNCSAIIGSAITSRER